MGTGNSGMGSKKTMGPVKQPQLQPKPYVIGSQDDLNQEYSNLGFEMFEEADEDEADEKLGYGNGGATDEWANNLSLDESDSVYLYTTSYYKKLNSDMRKGSVTQEEMKHIDNIESAISKFELTETTVFNRGSSAALLGGASTVEEIQAKVGQVVVDKAFTSTASAGSGFGGQIAYHILTPPGKGIGAYVKPISEFTYENEFLFNRNSAFEIKGAYKDSYGQVHCNLEYVGVL